MLLQAWCIISWPSVNLELRYSPEPPNLGQNQQFFVPRYLEIWRMTLKNNRAPVVYYFKLCVSFSSHWWIQIGVTVRKCPIWVKNDDFFSCVTLKFDGWPWKTIGQGHQAFWNILSSYMNLKSNYSPETALLGFDFCDLDLWPLTLTFCMGITFVNGNNSWKFHDHTMRGTLWKRCHRRIDGQTDRQTDRWTEVFLELFGRS